MAAGSVRVVVADDHEVVRCGLVTLLDETDVKVVAEASSGEDAVRLAIKHKPRSEERRVGQECRSRRAPEH